MNTLREWIMISPLFWCGRNVWRPRLPEAAPQGFSWFVTIPRGTNTSGWDFKPNIGTFNRAFHSCLTGAQSAMRTQRVNAWRRRYTIIAS